VLYVEDYTDEKILCAFARLLGMSAHPLLQARSRLYTKRLSGDNFGLAIRHHSAMRVANPRLFGLILLDNDSRKESEPSQVAPLVLPAAAPLSLSAAAADSRDSGSTGESGQQTPSPEQMPQRKKKKKPRQPEGLLLYRWQRNEIENYIFTPASLEAAAADDTETGLYHLLGERRSEVQLSPAARREAVRTRVEAHIPAEAIERVSTRLKWWRDTKMSSDLSADLLRDLIAERFRASDESAMSAIKPHLHSLVQHLRKADVDPEVLAVLQEIDRLARRATAMSAQSPVEPATTPVQADSNTEAKQAAAAAAAASQTLCSSTNAC
jgi:hypothetical protein